LELKKYTAAIFFSREHLHEKHSGWAEPAAFIKNILL